MDAEPIRPVRGGARGRVGRVRRNDDVVARRLDDETVLVHLGTNRIYTLNATAARLWELLEEGGNREAIEGRLQAEFGVDPGQLAEEIDRTLASLRAEGLVAVEADV